jgi:hypothetical protein
LRGLPPQGRALMRRVSNPSYPWRNAAHLLEATTTTFPTNHAAAFTQRSTDRDLLWTRQSHNVGIMPPHCDSLDGPVVAAARRALDAGDVDLALPSSLNRVKRR